MDLIKVNENNLIKTLEKLDEKLDSIHICTQQETIGKIKEFMNNSKGVQGAIISMAVAIVIQIGTFLFLWGALTNTVNKNTEYLWEDMTITTKENTRNLDRLITKLETLNFVAISGKKEN